jgi:endonuclease YncB( thermonuclease family)
VNKFLYAMFGVCLSCSAHAVPAVVDYVIDGDTFAATVKIEEDIGVPIHVRIINIDAPELKGRCVFEIDKANIAKDALSALLPSGVTVDLQNVKDDKFLGRIDASVILPDGRDVGEIMIQANFARPYSGGKRQGWCD